MAHPTKPLTSVSFVRLVRCSSIRRKPWKTHRRLSAGAPRLRARDRSPTSPPQQGERDALVRVIAVASDSRRLPSCAPTSAGLVTPPLQLAIWRGTGAELSTLGRADQPSDTCAPKTGSCCRRAYPLAAPPSGLLSPAQAAAPKPTAPLRSSPGGVAAGRPDTDSIKAFPPSGAERPGLPSQVQRPEPPTRPLRRAGRPATADSSLPRRLRPSDRAPGLVGARIAVLPVG